MNDNPQLLTAKLVSILVTILPALGMGFIFSSVSLLRGPLLTALINMTIYSMVAVLYFLAIGSINSLIFLFIGRVRGSRWPKRLAYAGGAIIWVFGIITSITMLTGR